MPIRPLFDEAELLAKIAGRDELAFKKVYDIYFSRTYAFAFHVLHSRQLSEEVVQEVMLKLWGIGDELREIRNLEGYLKTIAKRRAIDLLRRREVERKTEQKAGIDWKEGYEETEERVLLNETRRILENGVQTLPDQQRLVYQLCHQQGLKYEEVAIQLDISPGTVQTHMKVALKTLREYMRQHTDIVVLLIILKLM